MIACSTLTTTSESISASLRDDVDRAIGAHREAGADLLRGVVGAERDHDDLAAGDARVVGAVLEQPQRGLDRVLVERVDDPRRAGQIDVAVLDLGLLRRVGDPLHGNQDLHGDSFLARVEAVGDERDDPVGGAHDIELLRPGARRAGRDRERLLARAPTRARARRAMPKIMRAAMWRGIAASSSPRVLAVGDDAAEHAQEVGELRVVVLLHELAATGAARS